MYETILVFKDYCLMVQMENEPSSCFHRKPCLYKHLSDVGGQNSLTPF